MYIYLADYWKSQNRKYCDFCKCWITDNKPSVEFHEQGRRHKNNVEKRIKYIQKQSKYNERETLRVDAAIKKMESTAMEAYKLDVANNADLSSIALNQKLKESKDKVWQEAKTKDGDIYYWNTLTSESVWTAPKEGYISLDEQTKKVSDATKKQIKAVNRSILMAEKVRDEQIKQDKEEERARLAREKLKERRAEDLPEVVSAPIIPSGKTDPYGAWQTVRVKEKPEVDLQLPVLPPEPEPVAIVEEEPRLFHREFKEKVLESLGGATVGFRKRKIVGAAKRNTRQRLDDD